MKHGTEERDVERPDQVTTLSELPNGAEAHVTAVRGESAITYRLMEMGVIPGVRVRMIKSAPFGDPVEIRVRGYNLALRRSEAASVEIIL